ncbi:MAG: phenylalanine--tRNA ligase beta subunit-related protein, partial [Patescibacteria group bacterium]
IAVRAENVPTLPSPQWLRKKLESIGARSINTLVDITNFVLFDIGQPMHAFDASKVKGTLSIRRSRAGEKMTTLDAKELTFDGSELVIADDEGVLALAGVKGGKGAEVDANTTSVIFESANFQPTITRKTSTKHGIKTDASKRFENGITSNFAEEGMKLALSLLSQIIPEAKVSAPADRYPLPEKWTYRVGVGVEEVNKLLGSKMIDADIENILKRTGISFAQVEPRKIFLEKARSVLGAEYSRGASVLRDAPNLFDCSSLVSWVSVEAGYSIPRIAIDQFFFARSLVKEEILPGDLIFTNTHEVVHTEGSHYSQVLQKEIPEEAIRTKTVEYMPGKEFSQGIDHVGIFVGNGEVIHVGFGTKKVIKEKLSESPQFKNECFYRRVIEEEASRYVLSIPPERLDLRLKEDVIEEIGRLYGYEKIEAVLPLMQRKGSEHKRLFYGNKVRKFLIENGFSEVYTSSFALPGEGEVELQNPVAKDKPFMRKSLAVGMKLSLQSNNYYAPLLGLHDVKIFEIGNVFTSSGEYQSIGIALFPKSKISAETAEDRFKVLLANLFSSLGTSEAVIISSVSLAGEKYQGVYFEMNFDRIIEKLPLPEGRETLPRLGNIYRPLSTYPFVVRDIALFTPKDVSSEEIEEVISETAGVLLVRLDLFDTFKKGEQISFAFHLAFQSMEKTLSDGEVNDIMKRVGEVTSSRGWVVR